jgi:hypothetical protein
MKASSQDLRECVLRAVDQRYPRIEIVQFLGISLSTLKRYLRTTTLGADMCARKQFLVVPRKNGHRWNPTCCLNYKRMTTPGFRTTVTSGSRRTVSA